MNQSVPEIQTEQQLAEIIKREQTFAVLMFTAPWCGTCRMVYPQMQKLMHQFENTEFFKLSSEHFAYMNILSYPHFRVYCNGKLLGDYTGSRVEKIEEFIRDIVHPTPNANINATPHDDDDDDDDAAAAAGGEVQ